LLGEEPSGPLPGQAPLISPAVPARKGVRLFLASVTILGSAIVLCGGCAGVAEVTGTATQDDIIQLRNDLAALQRSVRATRTESDGTGALERKVREQATATEQQAAALTKRLDGLSTTLSDLSARVDELNARVESLTRQVRTATPQRGLGTAPATPLTATPAPGPAAGSGTTATPVPSASPAPTATPATPSTATAAPVNPNAPANPNAAAAPAAPAIASPGPSARPTTGTLQPSDIYQVAYIDYSKGNYPLAIAGFQEFLRRFPEHELADNAQYWIGESQVGLARSMTNSGQADKAQQALEQAVVEFKKVLANYPRGDKAPAALYKEALALVELKQADQAQARLQYLLDNFPQSEEAPLARERLTTLKAGR
jgi:tol-pal system protein YbgF